jgi:single-strand DNA-binding protein
MNNLNSIIIEGNMACDPQFHITPKGTPVCEFSLVSNRYFNNNDGLEREVSFFKVETWGKLAEACNKKGKKGSGVRVVGRLKQDRWQGEDGKPRARIFIVAEHVEFRPELSNETLQISEENAGQYDGQEVLSDDDMACESGVTNGVGETE